MNGKKRKENLVAGLVGAFLGSLLGTACIVLVGQLGYVASICGLVMAVCTLKGYELLGGTLSRKGAAIAGLLTLVMTYVAHQLGCAIEVAEAADVSLFMAFRSLNMLLRQGYLNTAAYWGGLAMLYLFTLLGAVPMVRTALRQGDEPEVPPVAQDGQGQNAAGQEELTIYAADPTWMRSLRLSVAVPILVSIPAVLIPIFVYAMHPEWATENMWVMLVTMLLPLGAMIAMACVSLVAQQPAQAFRWVFVRNGSGLWRVELARLNAMDTYRFTRSRISLGVPRWDKLSQEEQAQARQSIQRAIQTLSAGGVMGGSMLSRVVEYLPNPQLVKENKWSWTISYGERGEPMEKQPRRRKMLVGKSYPGFAPLPGEEIPTGKAPANWGIALLMLAVIVGTSVGCVALSKAMAPDWSKGPAEPPKADQPASYQTYEEKGLTFRLDDRWEAAGDGVFRDPDSGVTYTITVALDGTEDRAVDQLTDLIGRYRTDPEFERFQFAEPSNSDTLAPLTAEDQFRYRYEIVTIAFKDGRGIATGVCLANSGILVQVETDIYQQDEGVRSCIKGIFTRMDQTGPTEATYQSMRHVGKELGYERVEIAYIHSPYDNQDFMRVPLPVDGEVEYLADGDAIRSQAHGIRVLVSAVHAPDGPEDIVQEGFARFQQRGYVLDENSTYKLRYDEGSNMASKQVGYLENGQSRVTFLVAQPMQREGYYRYMEITYLPEGMDDVYPDMVEELGDASDLSLPVLDPF